MAYGGSAGPGAMGAGNMGDDADGRGNTGTGGLGSGPGTGGRGVGNRTASRGGYAAEDGAAWGPAPARGLGGGWNSYADYQHTFDTIPELDAVLSEQYVQDQDQLAKELIDKREKKEKRSFFKNMFAVLAAPLTMGWSLALADNPVTAGVKGVLGHTKDVNTLKGLAKEGSTVAQSHLDAMAGRTEQSRQNRAANENWDSPNRTIGGDGPVQPRGLMADAPQSSQPVTTADRYYEKYAGRINPDQYRDRARESLQGRGSSLVEMAMQRVNEQGMHRGLR